MNPIRIHADGDTISFSTHLDRQELRASLLFWDKLDYPTQRMVGMDDEPDVSFLRSTGVMQRTASDAMYGSIGQVMRRAFLETFEKLDREEPGRWSLAVGERSLSFESSQLIPERGALVKLYGAVPVPNEDVSLVDLLDFKEKRRPELLALRHHLEQVYQRVVSAGDGPLAWNTEIGALEGSIADHLKVAKESKIKFRLADLNASLNVVPVATGMFAAYQMGLPLLAGLVPGLAAGISLDIGAALKGKETSATPFRYVSAYHQELF